MSDPSVVRGSCLCGRVRYEIDAPLGTALHCHCSMCRKAQGSAFRTRAAVARSSFQFRSGEELLTRYESSPGTFRCFCSVCGSPIATFVTDDPGTIGLPLGALDDDPGVRPVCHVHVASKAPWHEITDALPQFAALPDRS
jgi:hypothetical protein